MRHVDEAVRYDGNTGEHYHIRCVTCGRVSDLPVSVDRKVEQLAQAATNYSILGHEVEVHGICPNCQESHSNNERRSHQNVHSRPRNHVNG